MDLTTAIILGVVQGLTEFLPVSSSGHLVLVETLFGGQIEDVAAINVLVHLGSLLAIVFVFRAEILSLFFPRFDMPRLGLLILLTIPAVVVGLGIKFALSDDARHALMGSPWVACSGLLLTSLLLLYAERERPEVIELESVDKKQGARAFLIGLAQALAILPGISRSGATISTALMLGWTRASAVTLSFLLGVIAISGAGVLEARNISELELLPGLGAFISSLVFSLIGLKLVRLIVNQRRLRWFAFYTALIGVTGLLLLSFGSQA